MNTTHYEISLNGELDRVETSRVRLQPNDAFYEAMSRDRKFRVMNVMRTSSGLDVHIRVSTGAQFAYWQIDNIPMNSAFQMVEDQGVYVPDFKFSTGSVKMKLDWVPPMPVMLGFSFSSMLGSGVEVYKVWMCAFGTRGAQYRLPLANTFATGELCAGDFKREHVTLDKAVLAVETQFNQSTWNADLWDTITQTRMMFRWKPSKDKMEQQPVLGNWTDLCTKIAVPELEYLAP